MFDIFYTLIIVRQTNQISLKSFSLKLDFNNK